MSALPRNHDLLRVAGAEYYYHAGVFYRRTPTAFVVVHAPVGARVATLPLTAERVDVRMRAYWYYGGTFYRLLPVRETYEVVRAPVGAEVKEDKRNVSISIRPPARSRAAIFHCSDGFIRQTSG